MAGIPTPRPDDSPRGELRATPPIPAMTTYTPAPPDVAECPRCGDRVGGAPVPSATLVYCSMMWDCPSCGQRWHEARQVNRPVDRWTGEVAP
jgi:hypothetical protein